MKFYIKFAMLEVIIMILMFIFCLFMIHISNDGDAFIPNYITVYFLIPYTFLVIFGILLYNLSAVRAAYENEILIFAVLNFIMGAAIIAFNILLFYGIIPSNTYFFFLHHYGRGTSFILSGFNLAYSCKNFKEYICFRKNIANNAVNTDSNS